MNSENLIEKLLTYYNVKSVAELSPIISTSQATISNWKIRNSINAIKKKCRELGIYDEIFGDINTNHISGSNISGSGVNNGDTIINNSSKPSSVPDFIIEDLEVLFKRAKDNKDSLIDAIDDFISAQKKLYR